MAFKRDKLTLSLMAARVRARLSRAEAAEKLGVSVAMLGKYERGEVEPGAIAFQRMLILYDVGPEDIEFEPNLLRKKNGANGTGDKK